jgi:hypothetical protein
MTENGRHLEQGRDSPTIRDRADVADETMAEFKERLVRMVERSEAWLRARHPAHPALKLLDEERTRGEA